MGRAVVPSPLISSTMASRFLRLFDRLEPEPNRKLSYALSCWVLRMMMGIQDTCRYCISPPYWEDLPDVSQHPSYTRATPEGQEDWRRMYPVLRRMHLVFKTLETWGYYDYDQHSINQDEAMAAFKIATAWRHSPKHARPWAEFMVDYNDDLYLDEEDDLPDDLLNALLSKYRQVSKDSHGVCKTHLD